MTESSWVSRWNKANENDNFSATGEAARRYYSAKEYLYYGAPNVFRPTPPALDNRFFDDWLAPSNKWYQYDNTPLRESLERHASFPIGSSFEGQFEEEKNQPRLLVVSVDVESGAILTFDSYKKRKENLRKSEYVDYTKAEADSDAEEKVAIFYKDGIMPEHVMASSSVPVHYKYTEVPEDYGDPSTGHRKFWDGGILSNTPLRELIQAHEDYWREEAALPELQVYIVNIWPNEKGVPQDHDAVVNRKNDFTYQDKTVHEEKVAYLIHDYIDLVNLLKDELERSKINVDKILKKKGSSKHRDGEERTYQELIERKVRISSVTRIQRKSDTDEISYKWCDFSEATIVGLITHGFKETLQKISPENEFSSMQDHVRLQIEEESIDPKMAEDERLTQKQVSLLRRAIPSQKSDG